MNVKKKKDTAVSRSARSGAKSSKAVVDAEGGRRTCWITIILYPDNCYHMMILDYLSKGDLPCAWILHDPEPDLGCNKLHYHVLVRYDTARTRSAVIKSFGEAWAVKDDDGKYHMIPLGDYVPDYAEKVSILSYPLVKNCFSPEGDFAYMLHRDFASTLEGKTQYDFTDIHINGDPILFRRLSHCEHKENECVYTELYQICKMFKSCYEVTDYLVNEGRFDLLQFISGHAYFVERFFMCKGGEN